jgi:hypothetical protein
VMVVHSARFPRELSRLLEEEADRRGLNPSSLLRLLAEEALTRASAVADEPVTVRPSEIRQRVADAVDAVLRNRAA